MPGPKGGAIIVFGNAAVIAAENLTKKYGRLTAVDGLTLHIARGEIFGLLGPNGAGKTTTLEMLVGLRMPTEGSVTVLGLDPVRHGNAVKRRVAIQPQHGSLFEYLTVDETMRLFASFHGDPLPTDEVISWLGLEDCRRQRAGRLSGGQRQRLLVGAVLVSNADVLLLDEPTAGMDPRARRSLWDAVYRCREMGKTVLLTTHSMEEAQSVCHRVAIIDFGRCRALGTPDELIDRYTGRKLVSYTTSREPSEPLLMGLAGVSRVTVAVGSGRYLVSLVAHDPKAALQAFMESRESEAATDIRLVDGTLEDVFLALTGRAPGENGGEPPRDTPASGPRASGTPGRRPPGRDAGIPNGVRERRRGR